MLPALPTLARLPSAASLARSASNSSGRLLREDLDGLPPVATLLRGISDAGRAGLITIEEKGKLKDEVLSGNHAEVAASLQ
jgi:hypothetical protein